MYFIFEQNSDSFMLCQIYMFLTIGIHANRYCMLLTSHLKINNDVFILFQVIWTSIFRKEQMTGRRDHKKCQGTMAVYLYSVCVALKRQKRRMTFWSCQGHFHLCQRRASYRSQYQLNRLRCTGRNRQSPVSTRHWNTQQQVKNRNQSTMYMNRSPLVIQHRSLHWLRPLQNTLRTLKTTIQTLSRLKRIKRPTIR